MHKLRWLALGDSYTIGEGVDLSERWTTQLAARLQARGVAVVLEHTIATTGWTTDELAAAMQAQAPLGDDWDFVTLLIGVNNQYRQRALDNYTQELNGLLQQAIGCAGGRAQRVMMLSIPDYGITPFAAANNKDSTQVAAEIDAFNAAAARACAAYGIAFVDITAISRSNGADAAMLVADGLHPSALMYARWAAQAEPVALQILHAA